jgi:hypothetical protein
MDDDVLGIDIDCNLNQISRRVGECMEHLIDPDTCRFADEEVQTKFDNWLARGGWDKYADEQERSAV